MKGKHVLVYNAPWLRITTATGGEIPNSKYQALQNACSWSFSMAHVGLSSPFMRKIFKMLQDILLLEKKQGRRRRTSSLGPRPSSRRSLLPKCHTRIPCTCKYNCTYHHKSRGELSYLAPLGSENISAPYFKQCFFQGGLLPPRLIQTPRIPVPRQK